MANVKVTWVNGMTFLAADAEHHSIVMDAKPEHGGEGQGVRPLDLLLMAQAGCMAMDIVSILQKKRTDLRWYTTEVDGDRSPTDPKRFTAIRLKIRVNPEVKPDDLQRAFELSRDKYCSVLGTLQNAPAMAYDVGVSS